MLTARVILKCTSHGRSTVVDRLTSEARDVPGSFGGCELFSVSVDAADPNTVVIVEEWANRSKFDAYTQSNYFAESMEIVAPHLVEAPNSAYYESVRVGP